MLDGKILRGLTGTPMRRIALANSALAEAEPEPLTLANLMTKSLMWCCFSDCMRVLAGLLAHVAGAVLGALCLLRHAGPACAGSRKNFCISQAPVGQRSAHNPQCRQTSSSLTMMRPVFNGPEAYRSWVRFFAGARRRS